MFQKEEIISILTEEGNYIDAFILDAFLKNWKIDPIYEDEKGVEYFDEHTLDNVRNALQGKTLSDNADSVFIPPVEQSCVVCDCASEEIGEEELIDESISSDDSMKIEDKDDFELELVEEHIESGDVQENNDIEEPSPDQDSVESLGLHDEFSELEISKEEVTQALQEDEDSATMKLKDEIKAELKREIRKEIEKEVLDEFSRLKAEDAIEIVEQDDENDDDTVFEELHTEQANSVKTPKMKAIIEKVEHISTELKDGKTLYEEAQSGQNSVVTTDKGFGDFKNLTIDITNQTLTVLADALAQKITCEVSKYLSKAEFIEEAIKTGEFKKDNELLLEKMNEIIADNKVLVSKIQELYAENSKFVRIAGNIYIKK